MSIGSENGDHGDHLPPPAFPSARRAAAERDADAGPEGVESPPVGIVPEEAFISPDDDLVVGQGVDDALIDPDTPVVREKLPMPPEDFEEVMGRARSAAEEIGQATGMGDEIHLDLDPYIARWGDPHLARVAAAVAHLAHAIEERGEAGLRTSPGMTRFEATLRAYCVGYLGGLRNADSS